MSDHAVEKDAPRPRVHRPAASATWTHQHRWGAQLGDSTDLRVTRTDGGGLTVSYGKESTEIRAKLVSIFADMVAAAAAWSDRLPECCCESSPPEFGSNLPGRECPLHGERP